MFFQIASGADARNHEKEEHEPRIYHVLEDVVVLSLKACDVPHNAGDTFGIVHVDDVIDDDNHDRHPFDIVQIMLSHTAQ